MKKLLLIIVILAMGQGVICHVNKFPNINNHLAEEIALEECIYEVDY